MQKTETINALVWFRNDLRIHDQTALYQACSEHQQVLAIYCIDPRQQHESVFGFKKTDKFRIQFLLETLSDLKQKLKSLNIEFLIYNDFPEAIIPEVCQTYSISDVYSQKEWTSEEVNVEKNVKTKLQNTVLWHTYYDQFLYHPDDVQIHFKTIPQVFTSFRKRLEKYANVRSELNIKIKPIPYQIENTTQVPKLEDLGYETYHNHPNTAFPFKGGETEALARLNDYTFNTKKLGYYKKTRNGLIGKDYSSKLSAWLANGSLSPRTVYWTVKQFEKTHFKNQSTYWLIFELIWRDYFKYISKQHGSQIFKLDGILKKQYSWSNDQIQVQKWIHGETSNDFVNANMIELKTTGWMSNRGRQNVASYFAKTLQLDWRIGAAYFESLLIDYDVHSNYGNWMYVAGVGNDPRDRVFNVELQAERYDTDHRYRSLWLQTSLF